MKLRSGKQTLKESESLACDAEKRSAKVSKMKQKRKKSCDGMNFIACGTAHRLLSEDGGEGCLRPMAVAANCVVSKTAVMGQSQGSALPNALTDESSVSPDSAITNDSTNFHLTSSNSILKNLSVKQRHQDILVETVSQKINDSSTISQHNNQSSTQEYDSCSVISLASDREVIILDSNSEPQSDCSSTSDIVVIDIVSSTKDVPTSDVMTVGQHTPSRQPNKFQPHERATRKSIGPNARKMRKKMKQKLKAVVKEDVSVLHNVLQTVQNKPNGLSSVRSRNIRPGIVPFATAASAGSNFAPNSSAGWMQGHAFTAISSTMGYNQMHGTSALSAGVHGHGLQHWNNNAVRVGVQPINNRVEPASTPFASLYGTNLYNPNPYPVRSGLRPIIIDGSNVAMGHSNGRIFSCKGLKICIDYFLKRWHKVVGFVPQFRKSSCHSLDTKILDDLEKQGLVSFTPSRKIGNRLVVAYDDRYIVQYAAECGGVIVSTDNYRDLLKENPAWRETIENRLLMFTWVGDVLMFPQDPLGRYGPNLDRFLRFP